ncbi:hypothetical protein evm_013372 [Chilo suppressalis]|nr:hypothetical protein evm_013372 [Chilo suppressalis]
MNADLKDSFSRIKPFCDVVMVCPTPKSISNFVSRVADLKTEAVQELQQYLLFPFITHIKSTAIQNNYEYQWKLVDGMRVVLEKVTVNSFEMCIKIETSLLQLVFDNSKPGMIADVPEELKHSVMKCLTVLLLSIDRRFREKLLKTKVPLLAQAVFVSVHIAKLEKMRALRWVHNDKHKTALIFTLGNEQFVFWLSFPLAVVELRAEIFVTQSINY